MCEDSLIDDRAGKLAPQYVRHLRRRSFPQFLQGFFRIEGRVRGGNDLRMPKQGRVGRRGLLRENVQPRPGKQPFVQSLDQRGTVDDLAAAGVNHEGSRLHFSKGFQSHQVPRLWEQGHVEGNKIAAC